MLKNEELKQINYTTTLLQMIKEYAWESDDFYDKTGITIIDIEKRIKALKHIHTTQKLKKKRNSQQSTEYKKLHKEHRNIMQNINYARHKGNKKKLEYWTQKLKEHNKNS